LRVSPRYALVPEGDDFRCLIWRELVSTGRPEEPAGCLQIIDQIVVKQVSNSGRVELLLSPKVSEHDSFDQHLARVAFNLCDALVPPFGAQLKCPVRVAASWRRRRLCPTGGERHRRDPRTGLLGSQRASLRRALLTLTGNAVSGTRTISTESDGDTSFGTCLLAVTTWRRRTKEPVAEARFQIA
jgi:hypothetical protein